MPLRGLYSAPLTQADKAILKFSNLLYKEKPSSKIPISDESKPKYERNADLKSRYRAGESIPKLAEVFGISWARVHQIIHSRRK